MGRATVVLALLLWGLTGHAQDMDLAAEAELHFQLGIDAYLGRQYQQALEHLMLSNRLAPNPSVAKHRPRLREARQLRAGVGGDPWLGGQADEQLHEFDRWHATRRAG